MDPRGHTIQIQEAHEEMR